MPKHRKKHRPKIKRPKTLVNVQVKFCEDTYMAVDRFMVMGRHKPLSRSATVRGLLDLGILVWKPDALPFKAILSENVFKVTRVMLRPEQVDCLKAYGVLGYAEDLALNLAMRAGIKQADAMRRVIAERRRISGDVTEPNFALPR